jgi:phage shock protein C
MQNDKQSLFSREDTLLGVCQGLADDFGFNPLFLRLTLAVLLLWNPPVVLGIYFGLGAIVVVARLLFPDKRQAESAPAVEAKSAEPRSSNENDRDGEPVALAA